MTEDIQSMSTETDENSHEVRVLVVDDSETDRRAICRTIARFNGQGYHVDEAATFEEALQKFDASQHHCLLLDYVLPGKNGLELLKSLPVEADNMPPEAIVITVNESHEVVVEALRLGVRDFLRKDQMSPTSLWQAISRAVDRRRMRQELVRQRQQLEEQNAILRENQRALLNIMEDLEREMAQRRVPVEPQPGEED